MSALVIAKIFFIIIILVLFLICKYTSFLDDEEIYFIFFDVRYLKTVYNECVEYFDLNIILFVFLLREL